MRYPLYNRTAYFGLYLIDLLLKGCVAPFLKKRPLSLPPKKILFCNIAHLGDVILTTSLFPVLKKAYPNCEIGMLIGSWSKPLLREHPLVNHMHCVDHWKVNREPLSFAKKLSRYSTSCKQALKEIREEKYDIAIDVRFHYPNTAFLLWRAHIPMRIGYESAGFSSFLTHLHTIDWTKDLSVVDSFFSLLEKLNVKQFQPFLQPTLNIAALKSKKNYIVVHMGAGNHQKRWPKEKWRALTKKLICDYECIYFTGRGEEERREIEEVIEHLPHTHNLCDQLDLKAFTQLIQQASLLVSVDTSAGHIAAAVQTQAVLIYPGIHPPNLWRPYGAHIKIVSKKMPCSPCFRGCSSMSCIKEITVEEIKNTIQSLQSIHGKRHDQ